MSNELVTAIEAAWERRADITPADQDVRGVVDEAIALLDSGEARVAEPDENGGWKVNQWLKKAVLLSFRVHNNRIIVVIGQQIVIRIIVINQCFITLEHIGFGIVIRFSMQLTFSFI